MAKYTVTPADLRQAMKDARAGDTLVLVGEFDPIHWRAKDLLGFTGEPVTFDMAKAIVTGWQFTEIKGLTFLGGTIKASPGEKAGVPVYGHGVRLNKCRDIIFKGVTGIGPARFEEGEAAAFGDGIAIRVLEGENVQIADSVLQGFKTGVSLGNVRQFEVARLNISDMRSDGIQAAQSWFGEIAQNVIHSSRKRSTEHPDGVQLWSRPDAPPTSDIVIRDNVIVGKTQGICGFNHIRAGVDDGGFDRLTIVRNRIVVDHAQALAIYSGRDIVVADNDIQTLQGATSRASLNLNNCTGVSRSGNTVGAGAGKKADNDAIPVAAKAAEVFSREVVLGAGESLLIRGAEAV